MKIEPDICKNQTHYRSDQKPYVTTEFCEIQVQHFQVTFDTVFKLNTGSLRAEKNPTL